MNAVTRIVAFDEVPGGSTGRKVLLRVEYDNPVAGAHCDLFVKFSRDFDDPIRDRGKTQMESEVLFASLSREPGFPITVPATQFADYHREYGHRAADLGANSDSAPTASNASTTSASTTRCPSRWRTTARC